MNNKEFKNLDEQIDILRSKGLVINDSEYAKEVLLRENYFFLNGYRHLFLKSETDKKFLPGTEFNELYSSSINNIILKHSFMYFGFGQGEKKLFL